MSLLQHYNTIRLVMAADKQAVIISDLIGFKLNDKDRQDLSDVKQYCALIAPEVLSNKAFSIAKKRSEISAEIARHQQPYSSAELESLADQLLYPEADNFTEDSWQTERRSIYNRSTSLQHDFDLALSIAAQLIERQRPYLCSRNWMDKKKVTYLEIAAQHPQWSEATIRRRIQAMKFCLNGWRIPATDLICSNDLPLICKHITRLLKTYPHAGRPTLYRLLYDEGYDFSDRNIGNAMKLLDMAKRLGDKHEFF